jgi:hypothetical protein
MRRTDGKREAERAIFHLLQSPDRLFHRVRGFGGFPRHVDDANRVLLIFVLVLGKVDSCLRIGVLTIDWIGLVHALVELSSSSPLCGCFFGACSSRKARNARCSLATSLTRLSYVPAIL